MAARNLDPQFVKTLEILDAAEAAVYLRSSPSTLAKRRCYGGGPRFIRQSARKVVYRRTDLDDWLYERSHSRT